MTFSTRCFECEEYFRTRESTGDPLLKISDPDQIQAILHSKQAFRPSLMSRIAGQSMVWIDGPDWLVRRRMAQSSFHPREDTSQQVIVDWVVSGLLDRLDRAAVTGETISLVDEFLRMTTRFLYRFAFDINLPPDHEKAPIVNAFFKGIFDLIHSMLDMSQTLNIDFNNRLKKSFLDMDHEIELIMQSRPAPGCLLHALMEGHESGVLVDSQVRDEIRGLFIAGTETTSLALAWVFCLLDEHRSWRQRVEVELASGGPTPLVEAVLNETLRLFPTVPFTTRVVEASTDLGFDFFEERTEFLISKYHTHRNPEHWNDPHVFDPSRFLGEQSRHRYAWLPFGGGRHLCIGKRVARMEALDALRSVMRRYHFHRVDDFDITALMGITLKPSHPLEVTVERIGST
jgi:cytochrome P450